MPLQWVTSCRKPNVKPRSGAASNIGTVHKACPWISRGGIQDMCVSSLLYRGLGPVMGLTSSLWRLRWQISRTCWRNYRTSTSSFLLTDSGGCNSIGSPRRVLSLDRIVRIIPVV
jgi:hypothetical protein